jgi:DNA-binding response OmpR family regulator
MKVLFVEDDLDLSGALSPVLASRGFQLVCSADGLEALALARQHAFDAVLLDLGLPGIGGLEFLQRLRDSAVRTPVMVVTAHGAVEERVLGLNLGADDYLPKPFDIDELEARLRALVRRSQGGEELQCGTLRLDRATGAVFKGLRPLELSPRETALLCALMLRRGRSLSKEALHEAVFGPGSEASADAIEVLVHRLRRRLIGSCTELLNLRGVGYLLLDEAVAQRAQ